MQDKLTHLCKARNRIKKAGQSLGKLRAVIHAVPVENREILTRDHFHAYVLDSELDELLGLISNCRLRINRLRHFLKRQHTPTPTLDTPPEPAA